jgi:pilus assembly protein CpaB
MNTKFGRYTPALNTRTNDRDRLLFIAAAGLAFSLLIILVIVFNFRSDANARTAATPEVAAPVAANLGTISLITPERAVRAGTKLNEVRFKEVLWPRNQVPEEAVRDMSEIQNMYAKSDLSPGIPLQRNHLSREGLMSSLALTPRNRAVSIEVDETSGLEGHALPGTKVDIVLTFTEGGQLTSKVIVQNARVLSYGGDTSTAADRSAVASDMRVRRTSRTITLDVTPKDALQITTARQLGRLSLIMRSNDDDLGSPALEVDEGSIAQNKQERRNTNSCKSGRMRMGNREYVVDCDGSISQVIDPNEP